MKINYITYTLAFLMLATIGVSAQSDVYFFYDPACVQKFDYERINSFQDVAYVDYYISTSNDTKAIFRVEKDQSNQMVSPRIVSEIPVKPFMCEDRKKISGALIKEVNANRRVAYMVVETAGNYALNRISSISTLTENESGIVYNDPMYSFKYDYVVSKEGEILNKKNHKERNIFFEEKKNAVCLDNYQFKIVSRHIETPIKHLNLVSTVGVLRVHTTQGELRLKTINNVPVSKFIAQRCNNTLGIENVVDVQNPSAIASTKAPAIQDTIGMSMVDKRLWLSRQKTKGFTARSIKPIHTPEEPAGGNLPDDQGTSSSTVEASVKEELLPGGIYVVKEKENLYTISEKFGISIHRLVEINKLDGYSLVLNQALKVVDDGSIPTQSRNPLVKVDKVNKLKTTIHVVEQGQTLYEISKLYGLKLADIYDLNKQLTDHQIDINQQLVVGYEKL